MDIPTPPSHCFEVSMVQLRRCLSRGQRLISGQLVEQSYDLGFPWNILDGLFLRLRHEGSGIIGGKFLELSKKSRVLKGFAHGLAPNGYQFLRRARWKDVGRTHQAEGSEHRHDFSLSIGLGEALEFWQFGKSGMRMAIFLGNLNDGVKVNDFLVDELRRSLQNRVRNIGPSIQLATHHGHVEFRTGISGNKLWFFEAE